MSGTNRFSGKDRDEAVAGLGEWEIVMACGFGSPEHQQYRLAGGQGSACAALRSRPTGASIGNRRTPSGRAAVHVMKHRASQRRPRRR